MDLTLAGLLLSSFATCWVVFLTIRCISFKKRAEAAEKELDQIRPSRDKSGRFRKKA